MHAAQLPVVDVLKGVGPSRYHAIRCSGYFLSQEVPLTNAIRIIEGFIFASKLAYWLTSHPTGSHELT